MPSTFAISFAADVNRVVITLTAGTPNRSAVMLSCKLHDEHEPQSPMPVTTACHERISSTMCLSAGAE